MIGTALLATLLGSSPAPVDTLRYDITFVGGESTMLTVELSFRGGDDGATRIVLPREWAAHDDLHRVIGIVDAVDDDVTVRPVGAVDTLEVGHGPGRSVRIRYTVRQDWTGPFGFPQYFRPIVGPDWFQILGHNALIFPARARGRPLHVEMSWAGVPAGGIVANSFGVGAAHQRFDTTLDELLDGIFAGGRLRLDRAEADGMAVWVASPVEWRFGGEELAELAARVIAHEHRFWAETDTLPYFIWVLPAPYNTSGIRFTRSIALFLDPETELGDRLLRLVAHEAMHEWIGGRLRPEGPDHRTKWFTEGFNDYFAHRVLWRSGLLSDSAYAAMLDDLLAEYWLSPVREVGNAIVEARYWSDEAVKRLPYLRGHLLALRLDGLIHGSTEGRRTLHEAMRRFLRPGERSQVTEAALVAMTSAVAGFDVRPEYHDHIRVGRMIELDSAVLGPCFAPVLREVTVFDAGFDLDASLRSAVVTGVDSRGRAYEAGLRDGQRMRGIDITRGDPDHEAAVKIEQDGEAVWVRYLPASRERVSLPGVQPTGTCDG